MRKILLLILSLSCSLAWAEPATSTHQQTSHKAEVKHSKTASNAKDAQHKIPAKPMKDDDTPFKPYYEPNNKLYRSFIEQGDITHIDPFTGNLTMHLPLINIPGNDGLPLIVTLSFNNHMVRMFNQVAYNATIVSHAGYAWYFYTGDDRLGNLDQDGQSDNGKEFIDPAGNIHTLYNISGRKCLNTSYDCSTSYISKDNWYEHTDNHYGPQVAGTGYVIAPNGVKYTLSETNPEFNDGYWFVTQITSPNGGTVLTYHYEDLDDNMRLSSITRNDGYEVDFDYQPMASARTTQQFLKDIRTSDGRQWNINYVTFQYWLYSDYSSPTISSITQPNGETWQFTPHANGATPYPGHNISGPYAILESTIKSPNGLVTTLTAQDNFNLDNDNYIYMYDRLAFPYVTSKSLSGGGFPTATWTYSYPLLSFPFLSYQW
jgi:hypothetical protein